MTVYYTLPDHQADILGWMVDGARGVDLHLHEWTHHEGRLTGAGRTRPVLDADMWALAKTDLVVCMSRNYVYGDTYVLADGASEYMDNWRAQRQGLPDVEPTGWKAVDDAVSTLRKRLGSATTPNDYKAVGHECVTVLEALGRAAFDPTRHLPDGEDEPAKNDAKRKLDLFTKAVASGERFEHVRKIVREAYAQGHAVKHTTTPDRLDAEVSADAMVMLVSHPALGQRRIGRSALSAGLCSSAGPEGGDQRHVAVGSARRRGCASVRIGGAREALSS